MFQQAADLREEGEELKRVLDDLEESDWSRVTPFKNWTVNQVVQHLHGSDKMAVLALKDADGFIFPKCVSCWATATPKGGCLGLALIWA